MFTEEDKKAINVAKGTLIALYNKKMADLKDGQLNSMFFDDCIISGGCISSILLGEKVNDIDVYAKKTSQITPITKHIIDVGIHIKTTENNYDGLDASYSGPPRQLITSNAITLTNDVQFITMISEEDGARKLFDFVHCMPYYDINTNKLYISWTQLAAIKNKLLVPNLSLEKIKPRRVDKYIQKGWKIDKEVKDTIYNNSSV
jgi:hypothetical protein